MTKPFLAKKALPKNKHDLNVQEGLEILSDINKKLYEAAVVRKALGIRFSSWKADQVKRLCVLAVKMTKVLLEYEKEESQLEAT